MKNGLPYYRAFPRDFLEGTIGMPLELKGAYRLILDLIYMQGGDLPDDARYIAGLLGCSVRRWHGIRSDLIARGKVEVFDGIISNKRARNELETLAKFQHKQSTNASRPNKNNNLQKPWLNQSESESEPEPYRSDAEEEDTRAEILTPQNEREELLVAMGFDPSGVTASGRLMGNRADMSERDRWRNDLGLSHADQIEIIRDVVAKMGDRRPGSFRYFTKAMAEDAGRRAALPLTPTPPDDGGFHDRYSGSPARSAQGSKHRPDPALEQIARLAVLRPPPRPSGD